MVSFQPNCLWCQSGSVLMVLMVLMVPFGSVWFCSPAKKLGVTEVPLEVVNLISHATESRLRLLLEKASVIAQHRTDGAKVRGHRE